MIKTIAYHSAECDKCGKKIDSEPYMYKKEFIQMLRRYGWSIGKRCLCYECRGGQDD